MCSLTFWMTFCVSVPRIWGIWAQFHWLSPMPKYTNTGITQPSGGLYIWVGLHLMWNVKFNTLEDILCIDHHNLGYLGSISPTCPNSTDT